MISVEAFGNVTLGYVCLRQGHYDTRGTSQRKFFQLDGTVPYQTHDAG